MTVTARQKSMSFSGSLASDLARHFEAEGRPIRVGLIGSGEMGTDIVTQCDQMAGITVAAIAETNVAARTRALTIAGRAPERYVVSGGKAPFDEALRKGRTAITEDALTLCTNDEIDVVIDATGRPAVGAEIGLVAM